MTRAALIFVRPVAANGDLSAAARLIHARSIIWPAMNPAVSYLAAYFRMTDRTVIAAQKELHASGLLEYQWAKGHPTRRETHRIVRLAPPADPRRSRFGYVGSLHADRLRGQHTALMLLGLNSTGLLLNRDELAWFLGLSDRTIRRAWLAVEAALLDTRAGEDSPSVSLWPKACKPLPLQKGHPQVFLDPPVVVERPHDFAVSGRTGPALLSEDQEPEQDQELLVTEVRAARRGRAAAIRSARRRANGRRPEP